MNANLFRLVFSVSRGMWIPVWEGARARCAGGRGGRDRKTRRVALQVNAGALLLMLSAAHAELPVACGGACGVNGNLSWLSNGSAQILPTEVTATGSRLPIFQESQRAILNWQSFNIGAGNEVEFRQQFGADAAVLNRIHQGSASEILGSLKANGQVYLINQNGIIFGNGAQVNVGSLTASTLTIPGLDNADASDNWFINGIFSRPDNTVSHFEGSASGDVIIAAGATLESAKGGRIMILAPNIDNQGRIITPDGQALLAAGDKIYLQSKSDPALRGLLVEIMGTGGTVTNGGEISAPRGNVTLMGFAVNQQGRVSATTSVNANGSIRLLARDNTSVSSPGGSDISDIRVFPTRAGSVTLGEGSITEVRPDVADATTSVDQQKFNRSRIEVMGETITLAANSRIVAPSGEVTLSAGLGTAAPGVKGTGTIVLDAGSVIDVAGLTDVARPMEHNLLEVELRGEQLRDSPLQRDGILRGEKVIIDIRKGTPLADVSGYIDGVGKTVGERSVVGGNVTLVSTGDIIMRENAVLDVSGGQITYADGYLNTTQLISEGRVYDIGEASPDRIYESFTDFTKEHRKWGITESWGLLGGSNPRGQFAAGYVEGMSAGTLKFIAPGLVLDGTLRGGVTRGVYQREIKTLPSAGTLIIGDAAQASQQTPDFRTPDVIFQASRTAIGGDSVSDHQPLVMSTEFLQQGGFGQARIYSNGRISVPSGVVLTAPVGGEITLVGREVDVQGGMNAPAGTLKLQATSTIGNPEPGNVTLGEGASLLTRGLWVNDRPEIVGDRVPSLALIDGGSISLAAQGDVILGAGSMIDVSGGAWLSASGNFKSGKGGDITLRAVENVYLGGELQAYALTNGALVGKGGTLTLQTQEINFQSESDPEFNHGTANTLTLTPDFFQGGGFSKYNLTGTTGVTITAGTQLWPQAKNRLLQRDHIMQSSGANIDNFSQMVLLPQDQRTPVNLTLESSQSSATRQTGDLLLETGASIHADPGAQVALSSMGNLTVLGMIDAPAGNIDLKIQQSTPQNNGFIPSQAIWLGPHSQLLSRGFVQLQENDRGQQYGQVLRGGTVQIDAQRGYVVSAAGSLIDVSGVAADLDLPTDSTNTVYQATRVAGDAGRVVLKAWEGMLLDGDWLAHAGDGTGAAGGALEVFLNSRPIVLDDKDKSPLPGAPLQIIISNTEAAAARSELVQGDAIPDEINGKALLSSAKIQYAGFDKAIFKSRDEIQFQGDVSLNLKRSLTLDAPAITAAEGAHATLNTAYFALGTSTPSVVTLPLSGDGILDVQAKWIDVTGNSVLQGFKTVNLSSSGDMRLRGTGDAPGSLSTAADLTLKADQIYPTTLSQFTLEVGNNDQGTLTVDAGNGATPVLSAGGKLTLRAPNIVQRGVLKAPFGEIELDAVDTLTLDAGSITSTSAEGQIIPFGVTLLGGRDWVYNVNGSTTQAIDTPPERRIRLTGTHIDVREGATLDLSGGGDLYATEFVPGPGGSKDVLDVSNATNTYAIVPGLSAEFAPYDNALYQSSNLQPGDSVYLSGSEGLPAGVYVLLPARYALLPGAFLVTPRAGSQDMLPGQSAALLNGTPVVAGYRTVAGTDIRDARWSGFVVRPGASARQESEFKESYASKFFNGQANAQLTGDAGRLSINASQSLVLDGALLANHAPGTRGAEVDITAAKMAIVSRRSDPAGGEANGVVQLEVDSLNNLGAASLLLGGTRQNTKEGVEILVGANEVMVQNDPNNPLTAPEIILVANDTLTVKSGSVIEGKGTFTGKSKDLIIGRTDDAATLAVDEKIVGDGALLRVSAGAQSDITRLNVERTRGVLDVEAGAVLRADASVALDATLDTRSQGNIEMVNGALSLGASRISLGETATVVDGLVLSNTALAALTDLARLDLRSYSSVDLYGDVVLGSVDTQTGQPQLTTLSIEAAELTGYQNTGKTAVITAGNFTFSNPGKVVSSNVADGSGNLVIAAKNVVLGDQREDQANKAINGFNAIKIIADKEITVQGQGQMKVAGDLDLVSSRLTGGIGADQSIDATGQVNITPSAHAVTLPAVATLGAHLNISGKRIIHAGNIELPSGILTLAANGIDASDAVTLVSGSHTNMQGTAKTFGKTSESVVAYAPGGRVTLTSASGNVDIQSGALINVSGAAAGGDAGTLAVHATQGTALIAGNVMGNAAAQSRSGSVTLDTGTLADFSALNNVLNAGGFGESRSVRVRHGDINVAGADTLTAQHLKLVADDGKIDIQGTLDASANKGGTIGLYAKQNITLNPGAKLDVHATGNGEQGGKVTLATTDGEITLDALSEINVSGGENGKGGSVLLRAPRIDTDNDGVDDDVAIATLAGAITGASAVVVEGVKTYNASRISALGATVAGANFNAAITGVVFNDTQNFITNNKASIVARLGNAALRVRPGIDIYNNGDLELATADWDLGKWRFDGESGTLILRAQGDLNLKKSLSDGFDGATTTANLQGGESWSYQLVAGADTTSVDPLALLPQAQLAGKGHVKLANNALVRTGTGDIDIAAGANIELGNAQSVIYTAGTPVAALDGFTAPPASAGQAAGYTSDGGNITLTAQGDVKGAITKQFINEWLFRRAGTNPSWWLRFDQFQQNIGALGGGNITVTAGRDVINLSAVIPTTGRVAGAVPEARVLDIQGGGDLSITAGRNIQSGVYYVGRGHGDLHADGAITGRTLSNQEILHPVLALGDGDFRVTANGDVNLETVVNPTILPRSKLQSGVKSFFFTYDPASAISLVSLSGDTVLHNNVKALKDSIDLKFLSADEGALSIYPGTLTAQALQGNILLKNRMVLAPAPHGNFELLAAGDVDFQGRVIVSDADPAVLPGPLQPQINSATIDKNLGLGAATAHAAVPIHKLDDVPIRIIAETGSILGNNAQLVFPKQARFQAGQDIQDLRLESQNVRATDVTRLQAGRDIVYTTDSNSSRIILAGPGRLEMQAGRNVELGAAYGVETIGNAANPALAARGADVAVMAGVGAAPDYASVLNKYLASYDYRDELAVFIRDREHDANLTRDQALAIFASETAADQADILASVKQDFAQLDAYSQASLLFFNELRETGRKVTASGGDYQRGFDAIATLFPASNYQGDISLYLSQIKTTKGGNIDLWAPGGQVNAGLAIPSKDPNELGIVAVNEGSVHAFTRDDFIVNASRVFAMRGGDILMWSSQGDIDAGKGKKTALVIPPPTISVDSQGNVKTDFGNVAVGSGIRALTIDGIAAGDVDLIAPAGEVNAGDAGIGAAGNLNIAALRVVGADNIQVGGVSTGVPVADTGGLGGSLSGVSNLGGESKVADQVTQDMTNQAANSLKDAFKPSFLTVEVIGHGD